MHLVDWRSCRVGIFRNLPARVVVCCCVLLLIATGCGVDPQEESTKRRLQDLATAYLDFVVAHGTGPRDKEQLQRHLQLLAPFKRTPGEPTARAFYSERDGAPFVVRFGIGISQAEGIDAPAIAFESRGDDDSRYVAFANGEVRLISEEVMQKVLLAHP